MEVIVIRACANASHGKLGGVKIFLKTFCKLGQNLMTIFEVALEKNFCSLMGKGTVKRGKPGSNFLFFVL